MAYKVAQLRKEVNSNKPYMTTISNLASTTVLSPNRFTDSPFNPNHMFEDLGLVMINNNNNNSEELTLNKFEQGKTYYVRFKILHVPQYYYSGKDRISWDAYTGAEVDTLNVTVLLKNKDQYDEEENPIQIIGNFNVPKTPIDGTKAEDNYEVKYTSFYFVFTPSRSVDTLCLRIKRNIFDAIEENSPRNWLLDTEISDVTRYYTSTGSTCNLRVSAPRIIIDPSHQDADFCELNNIIPYTPAKKQFIKFGYQSRPGSLIVVNGEPIRLGRSGVYEIDNGTRITNFMIAAPNGDNANNIDAFLLDYAYIETSTTGGSIETEGNTEDASTTGGEGA